MSVIAFSNQKGGVGKTTSTYNIGIALARAGKKTVVIDFDSQASLTIYAGAVPYELRCTVFDALQQRNPLPFERCLLQLRDDLWLAPACQKLSQMEAGMNGRRALETILRRAIEPVRCKFDFILIDCPPQLSLLTVNALSCADYVLIPCKTDHLAYCGLELLLDTVQEIQELISPELQIMGVVATMYDQRVKSDKDVLQKLQDNFNVVGIVKQLASVKRGVSDSRAVTELDKDDEAAASYRAITEYIIEKGV